MKFSSVIFSLLIFAANSPLWASEKTLNLVSPASSELQSPVTVQMALEENILHARFEVQAKEINGKEHLGKGEYPYQFDVVELFISVSGTDAHTPYYEFEVSPYDEDFQVKVIDLKKPFQEGIQMGLKHFVQRHAGGWTADLWIPLENLGWDADPSKIVGNAYSILGKAPNRSFWSLSLPPMKKPNFHQPMFFKPLLAPANDYGEIVD